MAGETVITVVGNLVDDPELRFTPSGAAVANFRIASTPRTLDKQTNEWKDGDALFLSCSVWRQAAENVAESLQKGMRVVVQGRLKQRQYETREGEKRTVGRARRRRGRPEPEVRHRQGRPYHPSGRRGRLLRRRRLRWRRRPVGQRGSRVAGRTVRRPAGWLLRWPGWSGGRPVRSGQRPVGRSGRQLSEEPPF